MKQKLHTFINTPNHVAMTSIAIALLIGIFGYMQIHRAPTYTFATAGAGTIAQLSGNQSTRSLTLGFVSGGRIATVSVKVGDSVRKGAVLASLDAGNAAGVLAQAKANYQKVVNGATSPAIDVAKATVNSAQVALTEATKQQTTLVGNALRTLLNSSLVAENTTNATLTPPTISGTYTGTEQGTISFTIHQTGSAAYATLSGMVSGTENLVSGGATPIADTGLFLTVSNLSAYADTQWNIQIPNVKAVSYVANYNAYQSALQTKSQVLASAQANLDQANAALTALVSAARPEDIAGAQAQVEIAQAAYENTVIVAPADGTVTAVLVAPGQIATANAGAIELQALSTEKNVAIAVPVSAIFSRNGISYVLLQKGNSVVEQAVTLGDKDAVLVEITGGLVAGDKVVIQ